MRKVLEELYHGNINPNERILIRNTQYDTALKVLSENEDVLSKLLEGKERSLFLDLMNAQSEISGITSVEYFIEGFRLGARMGIEVMDNGDGCFVDID